VYIEVYLLLRPFDYNIRAQPTPVDMCSYSHTDSDNQTRPQ